MPVRDRFNPGIWYTSDNEWGVPSLRLDNQPSFIEGPTHQWGQISRRSRSVRTWLFYVDDYKFKKVWDDPDSVSRTQATVAGEPNYSSADDMPKARVLWNTYRKRWLSRFWQDQHMGVLVDLNVPSVWDELNLLGVPSGWTAYCTRAADYEIHRLHEQASLARERAGQDIFLVVYSGGKLVRRACLENNWHFVGDHRNELRRLAREKFRKTNNLGD